jgi:hypothetical protein
MGGISWAYAIPAGIGFVDGKSYTTVVRAVDAVGNSGNTAPSDTTKSFIWDVTNPTTVMDNRNSLGSGSLVNDAAYSSLTSFAGTAADTSPGLVQSVDTYIKEGGVSGSGSGIYWSGTAFNAAGSPTWLPAQFASPNFSTSTASIPWANGQTYWLRSKAQDYANNEEGGAGVGGSIVKIHFDSEKPISKITNVTNGSFLNALTTLNGTASDLGTGPQGGQINAVYIHLYRTAPSNLTYNWSTLSWVSGDNGATASDPAASVYWSTVTYTVYGAGLSSGTWSLTLPSLAGLSGNQFRLIARGKDWASNVEVAPSTVTFTLDEYQAGPPERPVATLTFPTNGLNTAVVLSSVTGNGVDNVGGVLNSVGVMLRRFNSNGTTNYWNGFGWAGVEPGVWPAATADDGAFNSNFEPFSFTMPPSPEWTSNLAYDARAKGIDSAGNTSVIELSTVSYVYDPTPPDTSITFPVDAGFISQSGNIAGSASDTGAGTVSSVLVRVRRSSDNKFLDISGGLPGSWVTDASSNTWNSVTPTGSGPWTWVLSTAAWSTGETYQANAYAKDKALNYDASYSTVTFSADFQAPASVINQPSHGASISSLASVTGTAIDTGPAGIKNVYVAFYSDALGKWWNKNTTDQFILSDAGGIPVDAPSTSSNYWVKAATAAGTPVSWTVTGVSTPTFPATGNYQVLSAAEDIASNVESRATSAAANTSRISFSWIPPLPASSIQKPDATTPHLRSSLATLSGTANIPTTGVDVRIKDITNASSHLVWNGSMWVSSSSIAGWIAANYSSPPAWSYTIPSSSFTSLNKYQIESRAAGSPTENPVQGPNVFYIDDGNPTAAILMPDVLYKQSLPIISGTAVDDADGLTGASKSVYLRLRRTVPSTQYWVSISSSWVADSGANCLTVVDNSCLPTTNQGGGVYSVTHSSFVSAAAFEPGKAYTVYMVVKDRATNGVTVNQSFTWDVTPPVAGITRPTASQPINNLTTISGTSSDDFAVSFTSISLQSLNNDKCYDPGTNFFTHTCPYWVATSSDVSGNWQLSDANIGIRLSEDNTYYVLLSRSVDVGGNYQSVFTAGVSSQTFLADTVAPVPTITFPVHNAFYKGSQVSGGANPFTGTVNDPGAPFNSGIRQVQLRLSYLLNGDTWYWQPAQIKFSSGTAVSASGWINASDTTWDYFGSVTWGGVDRQYTLEARAEDLSFQYDGTATGNTSIPSTIGTDVIKFVVDNTPPTEGITAPSATNIVGLTQIAGTADATLSGLNRVEIKISTGVGSLYYWTASSFTTTETWLTATNDSSVAWHYTVPIAMVADATYTVVARSLDFSGNY